MAASNGRDCLIFATRNKEPFVPVPEALRANDPKA